MKTASEIEFTKSIIDGLNIGGVLNINTNDGAVIIDTDSMKFNFTGMFGGMIEKTITTHNMQDDSAGIIELTALLCSKYSARCGGVTITNITKD